MPPPASPLQGITVSTNDTAPVPHPLRSSLQVKADLTDQGAVEAALQEAGVRGVTHIFHCAYLMLADPVEECKVGA